MALLARRLGSGESHQRDARLSFRQQQQEPASVERGSASSVHLWLARASVTPGSGPAQLQACPTSGPGEPRSERAPERKQEPFTAHPTSAAVGEGG